jgi:hypothetical protein
MPATASRTRSTAPAEINRRVTIRRPVNSATFATVNRKTRGFDKVRVHDVSEGGIALLLRRAPEVGDTIYLQVCNSLLGFIYDMPSEVRHVTHRKRGSWLVGLAFATPLSHDELATLI